MADTFSDYIVQLAPAWLRDALGGGWLYSHGLLLDGQVEAARQAVAARFLSTAPNDALAFAGDERQIPQPAGADLQGWRAYLKQAWVLWERAGTRAGMIEAFAAAGFHTVAIYSDREWPNGHTRWSDYRIVVGNTPWTTDGNWGDPGTWGDGGTWGSTASEADIAAVFRIVRLWQPAEGWCQGVVVVFSGDPVLDPSHAVSVTWRPKD